MHHQDYKVKVSFYMATEFVYIVNFWSTSIFQRSGAVTGKALVAMLLLTLGTNSKSELDDYSWTGSRAQTTCLIEFIL